MAVALFTQRAHCLGDGIDSRLRALRVGQHRREVLEDLSTRLILGFRTRGGLLCSVREDVDLLSLLVNVSPTFLDVLRPLGCDLRPLFNLCLETLDAGRAGRKDNLGVRVRLEPRSDHPAPRAQGNLRCLQEGRGGGVLVQGPRLLPVVRGGVYKEYRCGRYSSTTAP